MSRGTVNFFSAARGCGFIPPDGGASDAFNLLSAAESADPANPRGSRTASFDVRADTCAPGAVNPKAR